MKSFVQYYRLLLVLAFGVCGVARSVDAEIRASLESPPNKQKVTGLGVVAGWAFSTDPGVTITKIQVRVDEKPFDNIAFPGERSDVAQAFPTFLPQSLNSGFAYGANFSGLSAGAHKIGVQISDSSGKSTIIDNEVTIIRVGDFALLSDLNLVNAKPSIDGKEVKLTLVEATEKPADLTTTPKTQQVTLHFAWQPDRQALGIVNSENTSTATTPGKPRSVALSANTTRDSRAEDSGTIRAVLENPASTSITVSGKGLVSGWAFSTTAGATIADVHLNIDGTPVLKIPCCTPRQDVAQDTDNKTFPQALQSGFATEVNFNNLSTDKAHTLDVVVTDSAQGKQTLSNPDLTPVRLGSLSFIDSVDLSKAILSIQDSHTLRVENFKVHGKDSNGVEVSPEVIADFQWDVACQCFLTLSSCGDGNIEPGEECDVQAFGGESCTSLGFSSGTLKCTPTCTFDTRECTGGQTLYVSNLLDSSVSVINTATYEIAKKPIRVGRSPRSLVVSPDGATLYVTNTGDDTLSIINTADNTVNATVPVGKGPQSVVVTSDGTKLYVVNGKANAIAVVSTATRQVLTTIAVGSEPQEIALTPNGTFAYVTNYKDNTVSVIDTRTNAVATIIKDKIGKGPNGIAVTPDGKQAYVVNFDGDSISIVDTATNAVLDNPISLGLSPVRVAFDPAGTRAYITSVLDFSLIAFDPVEKKAITEIQIGEEPDGIAISAKGKRVYVAVFGRNGNERLVDIISTITNGRVGSLEVGEGPFALALTPPKP